MLLTETIPEVRERLNTTNRGLFFRALLPLAALFIAVASNL